MKRHLFFVVVMAIFTTFLAMSDSGILMPFSFAGDGLSLVAYSQGDEDYLVEEIFAVAPDPNTAPGPDSYNIYNSSWQKICSVTDFVRAVSVLSSANYAYEGDSERFLFSQTLLNDDPEFEYIVEKNKFIENPGYSYYQTYGFKIMQTNGNCLADITYPDGSYLESPQFFVLKDKLYFALSCGSETYTFHVYEVNREGSSNVLKLVAENRSVAGYPNPVRRGEVYTVDGGKASLKNAVVNVVRLDGSLVQSFSTGNNDKVEIETSQMNGGVYIYTVIQGNKVVTSGRLVVE